MFNAKNIMILQVNAKKKSTIFGTFKHLWSEEKCLIFFKGLSARVAQTVVFSSFYICCYESVKKLSVKDEYKHIVHW